LIRLPEHGIRKDMLCDIRGNSPLKCINKISPRPVLIIAGGKDKFMPIDGIKRLFSNAYYPKNFTVINEADHNLSNETAKHEAFNIITKFFTKKLVEA
jgi:alpha-beta hydrolase superfamily lysophospholipase